MNRHTLALAAACCLAWVAWSTAARAEPEQVTADRPKLAGTDGVYGRFDGDLDISLAAGAELIQGGAGALGIARAFYLGTAGLYVAYGTSFGNLSAVPPRSLGLGVGVRPFFIPRWGTDRQRGPAILDLTIDATTFDMGVLWAADQEGHFTQAAGMEVGIGTEVPLAGQAAGPWLGVRAALRWRSWELAAADANDPTALGPAIFFTFSWHVLVNTHLVDVGDGIFR